MARISKDSSLYGKRGRVGQLVFRQLHGQTIVQAAEQGPRKPRSPRQLAHLTRFHRAKCYAKAQLADPVMKALYAARITKECTSAYTVAVRDYMRAPEVKAIDASAYQGHAGNAVRIWATDDFAVASVTVRIVAADGAVLEAGPATRQADGSWLYCAVKSCPVLSGVVVEADARDYPGNTAMARQAL